jgi:hypothetical protein
VLKKPVMPQQNKICRFTPEKPTSVGFFYGGDALHIAMPTRPTAHLQDCLHK